MSQQSAERPQSEAVDPEQLSDDGAGLGMGEKNTFEPEEEPDAEVEADPDNHQARFDLAQALHANGDVKGAVDQLLDLFRRDREWNDGAAKAQLLTIFEALPPQDPVALSGRRKLASMILV